MDKHLTDSEQFIGHVVDYLRRGDFDDDFQPAVDVVIAFLRDDRVTPQVRHRMGRACLRVPWEKRGLDDADRQAVTAFVESVNALSDSDRQRTPSISRGAGETAADILDLLHAVTLPERFRLLITDAVDDLRRAPSLAELAAMGATLSSLNDARDRMRTSRN